MPLLSQEAGPGVYPVLLSGLEINPDGLYSDEDMMNLCVIGNEVYQVIDSNVANAAVLGVEGTPSFIIGNHLITGYVSRRTFNSMMNEFSN